MSNTTRDRFEDQRRAARRQCSAKALVFVVDGRGIPAVGIQVEVVDLLAAGAGFVMEAAPSPGAHLFVLFEGRRSPRLLFGVARTSTLWDNRMERVGVEFLPIETASLNQTPLNPLEVLGSAAPDVSPERRSA